MLCDEVGLGKTIEAGLAIRQLVLSGVVRRVLIFVPRACWCNGKKTLRKVRAQRAAL